MRTKEEIIEVLKGKAKESWNGDAGEQRAKELEAFIRGMLSNYSQVLGFSEDDILEKIEGRRDYSAVNYYQQANFPLLDREVEIFETADELRAKFPSQKFRCPMCKGVSTHPTVCNSGIFMDKKKKKVCDWKAFGLFATMGAGYRFLIKETFLTSPVVHEVFMPIEFEK